MILYLLGNGVDIQIAINRQIAVVSSEPYGAVPEEMCNVYLALVHRTLINTNAIPQMN